MVANSIKEATGGSLLAPVADNKSQADKEVSQESCTTSISTWNKSALTSLTTMSKFSDEALDYKL